MEGGGEGWKRRGRRDGARRKHFRNSVAKKANPHILARIVHF